LQRANGHYSGEPALAEQREWDFWLGALHSVALHSERYARCFSNDFGCMGLVSVRTQFFQLLVYRCMAAVIAFAS
jgi:hypothetical protein